MIKEEQIKTIIQLIREGKSLQEIKRQTGLDPKTILRYYHLYKNNGNVADTCHEGYTLEKKLGIVRRVLERNISVNTIAIEEGIPAITIRRWIKTYEALGPDGLSDKRAKNRGAAKKESETEAEFSQKEIEKTNATIELSFNYLRSLKNDLKTVPNMLVSWGAFDNPSFNYFLLHFFRACSLVLSDNTEQNLDDKFSTSYVVARLMLATIPYDKDSQRKKAEEIIESFNGSMFLKVFGKNIPRVMDGHDI